MITTEIREPGIDGVFAAVDSDRPLRGVLALGWARLLAPERFACLALAYFNLCLVGALMLARR